MKIAILTPNYPRFKGDGAGTAGLFVESLAEVMRKKGHEVYIHTQEVSGFQEVDDVVWFKWMGEKDGAKLSTFKLLNPISWVKTLSLISNGKKSLLKLIKEKQIEHCICIWAVPGGFYARHAKKKLGTPYSVWTLGADIWTYPKYPIIRGEIKKILNDADFLFSDGVKLAEDTAKLGGKECEFLPSSRNLRDAKDIKINLDKKKKSFLFLGRYEPAKGPDVLINAICLLKEYENDFEFYLFGGGNLKEELLRKKTENKLENVHIGEFADQEKCKAYLKECDYLVIPSRIDSIPIVLSDAMQMECPVVATDVGDTGGLVSKYGVGLVIPSEDSKKLSEAIIEMSKKERSDFKENCKELYSMFDLENVANKYIDKLDSLRKV